MIQWVEENNLSDEGRADSTENSSEEGANHTSFDQQEKKVQDYFIEKVIIYYAKMCMHDSTLPQKLPSVLASGIIQVSLKVFEQIKKEKARCSNSTSTLS